MARKYMVLSAVGADRPGLVETLSSYIFERGGNVESSRAATLGGEFAIIMLVSAPEDKTGAIMDECDKLSETASLTVTTRPTTAPGPQQAADALPFTLKVFSMDHPGIVRALTSVLAQRKVNILALDTTVESAPHTGTQFFNLAASLGVPASQNIGELRRELQQLADSLNVDIQIQPTPNTRE